MTHIFLQLAEMAWDLEEGGRGSNYEISGNQLSIRNRYNQERKNLFIKEVGFTPNFPQHNCFSKQAAPVWGFETEDDWEWQKK